MNVGETRSAVSVCDAALEKNVGVMFTAVNLEKGTDPEGDNDWDIKYPELELDSIIVGLEIICWPLSLTLNKSTDALFCNNKVLDADVIPEPTIVKRDRLNVG